MNVTVVQLPFACHRSDHPPPRARQDRNVQFPQPLKSFAGPSQVRPDPVRHAHRYSLWSCAGCKEAILEKQWASEDSDSEWAEASGEYYPRRTEDSIQPKVFKNLNDELGRLYKEIVICFNEDCLLLCTIGLRALIEGVCKERGHKKGNLEEKVKELIKLLPSLSMIAEALQSLRGC
jgi:hypothetical protein